MTDLKKDHYEFEYALYIQYNTATPYINELRYVHDINGIKREIDEIEKKARRMKKRFYIDNEFYNNQYSLETGGIYYKFIRRKINDWVEFERI